MALSVAKGSFVANTSTGDQDVTVGFLPKGVIVWGTLQTATGYAAQNRFFFGVSDGTTHWCSAFADDDNVTPMNTGRYWDETAVIRMLSDGTPTTDGIATVTFTGSVLRFNWSDAPASAWIVHYLAVGGSDISVKALIKSTKATNGSQGETGVGFTPKALVFASCGKIGAGSGTYAQIAMGMASGPSNQVSFGVEYADTDVNSSVASYIEDDKFIYQTGLFGNPYWGSALTSLDADGWTSNWTTTEGFSRSYGILALGGTTSFQVGVDTQGVTTGAKDTSLSITPAALLLGSTALAADGQSLTSGRLSIGGSDGTTEGAVWAASVGGGVNPSQTDVATVTDKALRLATNAATTNAEADSTFASGKFTLNWTTADATARRFGYLAIGSPAESQASVLVPHLSVTTTA